MEKMYTEFKTRKSPTCLFCCRILRREYYFTCHVCGATYCYIHLAKHHGAHQQKFTEQTASIEDDSLEVKDSWTN